MLTAVLLLLLVLAVSYANGANDVSKGVATLVGSGRATYAAGLRWGAVWTVAGGITAIVIPARLIQTFSTGLLHAPPADTSRFLFAVALAVFVWVMLATITGLPVSTTHSLSGAIVGAALAMDGGSGLHWTLLVLTVLAPLALVPFLAALSAYVLHAFAAPRLSMASRYCVCLEQQPVGIQVVRSTGPVLTVELPRTSEVIIGASESCTRPDVTSGVAVTDLAHWATSAALSFARGMNDNPKIIAMGIGAAGAAGIGGATVFLAGAAAMGAGGYLYGRRVTRTLAERVTKIDPLEGLSASLVAATLVILASFMALPVSTTHVATGAIVGAGLREGRRAIQWTTLAAAALAWIVTLPLSALLAAAAWILVFSAGS